MRQCYERSDRGRCGCCRVPHRPHLASLTAPTNSHTRSPIQTPKKYHLTIASSHHLAASASENRALVLPHLTTRRSVGSWPPKLARSAFDAHWPPPEAWYLGSIRIASCGRICPLTCAKARGESVSCACAVKAAIADAVAAAECPTVLSAPPSRRPPTLTTAAPPKHAKISSRHHLLSAPRTLYELRARYRSRSPCLPPNGG